MVLFPLRFSCKVIARGRSGRRAITQPYLVAGNGKGMRIVSAFGIFPRDSSPKHLGPSPNLKRRNIVLGSALRLISPFGPRSCRLWLCQLPGRKEETERPSARLSGTRKGPKKDTAYSPAGYVMVGQNPLRQAAFRPPREDRRWAHFLGYATVVARKWRRQAAIRRRRRDDQIVRCIGRLPGPRLIISASDRQGGSYPGKELRAATRKLRIKFRDWRILVVRARPTPWPDRGFPGRRNKPAFLRPRFLGFRRGRLFWRRARPIPRMLDPPGSDALLDRPSKTIAARPVRDLAKRQTCMTVCDGAGRSF